MITVISFILLFGTLYIIYDKKNNSKFLLYQEERFCFLILFVLGGFVLGYLSAKYYLPYLSSDNYWNNIEFKKINDLKGNFVFKSKNQNKIFYFNKFDKLNSVNLNKRKIKTNFSFVGPYSDRGQLKIVYKMPRKDFWRYYFMILEQEIKYTFYIPRCSIKEINVEKMLLKERKL